VTATAAERVVMVVNRRLELRAAPEIAAVVPRLCDTHADTTCLGTGKAFFQESSLFDQVASTCLWAPLVDLVDPHHGHGISIFVRPA
jgi:hypothetical protein